MTEGENRQYRFLGDPEYLGPEPFAYRLHAWYFLECAELALSGYAARYQARTSPMMNVPIIHLICHAVEMFLKLALYKHGFNDEHMKKNRLRHNLLELKKECETVGVKFSADVSELIEALSPVHGSHRLRYSAFVDRPHYFPFTPPEMISIARKLIGASAPGEEA